MSSSRTLRLATRGSELALWQARHVSRLLSERIPGLTVELVEVSTTGDQVLNQPLRDFGGLGVFTREVQRAVLDHRADLAVHSLKDLPTQPHPDLVLAAVPERGATEDVLVLPRHEGRVATDLASLPAGARVATGSPRRQAQLKAARADLVLVEIRGNVPSRVRKLDAGECDALILARAGLERLGLEDRISQVLSAPLMYHAVGQGALGIECRGNDAQTQAVLSCIHDPAAGTRTAAERSLLAALRAGCHAPVGVASRLQGDEVVLEGMVLSADGKQRWHAEHRGPATDAGAVGRQLAEQLLAAGALIQDQTQPGQPS